MKNLIIILILLPLMAIAQHVHLQKTIKEIKLEYPNNYFKLSSFNTDEGDIVFEYTTFIYPYGEYSYYFKENNDKCDMVILTPSNIDIKNKLIKFYNDKYNIISNTPFDKSWIITVDNSSIYIYLNYSKETNIYYFGYM